MEGGNIVMNDDPLHFAQSLSSFTPSFSSHLSTSSNFAVIRKKSRCQLAKRREPSRQGSPSEWASRSTPRASTNGTGAIEMMASALHGMKAKFLHGQITDALANPSQMEKKTLNPLSITLNPLQDDPKKNPKPSYQGV